MLIVTFRFTLAAAVNWPPLIKVLLAELSTVLATIYEIGISGIYLMTQLQKPTYPEMFSSLPDCELEAGCA